MGSFPRIKQQNYQRLFRPFNGEISKNDYQRIQRFRDEDFEELIIVTNTP